MLKIFNIVVVKGVLGYSSNCKSFRLYLKFFSKTLYFNLNNNKNDEHSLSTINIKFKPTIPIKSIDVGLQVGIKDNAMSAVLVYTTTEKILTNLLNYYAKTNEFSYSYSGEIVEKNRLVVAFDIKIAFSIIYLIVEFFTLLTKSIILKLKNKERENDNGIKQTFRKTNGKLLYRS